MSKLQELPSVFLIFLLTITIISPLQGQTKWNNQLFIDLPAVKKIGSIRRDDSSYKQLHVAAENIFIAQLHDGKWGIVDSTNEVLIPFQFRLIKKYLHGEYFIMNLKGKKGILSVGLKPRIQCAYEDISCTNVSKCLAKLNNRWGVLNSEGDEVVPFDHIDIAHGTNNTYRVLGHLGWGLVDSRGVMSIQQIYDNLPLSNFQRYQLAIRDKIFELYNLEVGSVHPLDIDRAILNIGRWTGIMRKGSRFGIFNPEDTTLRFPYDEVVLSRTYGRGDQFKSLYLVRIGSKWSIYDTDSGLLVDVIYEKPVAISGHYILSNNGISKVISDSGSVVIPETDHTIQREFYNATYFLLKKDGIIHHILHENGDTVLSDTILEIKAPNQYESPYLQINTQMGWRLFNTDTKVFSSNAHEEITFLQKGYHSLRSTEGWRLFNEDGTSQKQFHDVIKKLSNKKNSNYHDENTLFKTGTAILNSDNNLDFKYGIIDKNGERLVNEDYIQITQISDSTVILMTIPGLGYTYNLKSRTIDSTLTKLYYKPIRRDYTTSPSAMLKGPKSVKIGQEGDSMTIDHRNLVYTLKGWKIANLDDTTKQLPDGVTGIETQKKVGIIRNGAYYFWKDDKVGMLDRSLQIRLLPEFDDLVLAKQMPGSHLNFAYVRKDDKYALMNYSGDILTPFKYDEIRAFQEGMARVRIGDRWGFIATSGEEKIAVTYHSVVPFIDGFSRVQSENGTLIIDKSNNCIVGCK